MINIHGAAVRLEKAPTPWKIAATMNQIPRIQVRTTATSKGRKIAMSPAMTETTPKAIFSLCRWRPFRNAATG